jgi:hypothetical protein
MKHYRSYGEQSDNKRKIIIVIAIVLAVLIVAAAIVGIVALVKKNKADQLAAQQAEESKQLAGIQIARVPNKTSYYCGEFLDTTGLLVYTINKGNGINQLNVDKCEITGFDSSVATKKQVITVTYKGFTDTFNIEIKEPLSAAPVLESISMQTLPKTEYKLGEGYDGEGGVILCKYTDGTTKTIELDNDYISGFRAAYVAGVGEYDITVTYTENGIQAQTTYKITITE